MNAPQGEVFDHMSIMSSILATADVVHQSVLPIKPAFYIWKLPIRWYSLAYLAGILLGWWYLLRLLEKPGAPMAKRHADDLVFYATLGVILGGRIGYVLFYNPKVYFHD